MKGDKRGKGKSAKPPGPRSASSSEVKSVSGTSSGHVHSISIRPEDVSFTRMLETLKPHDHLCLIYESQEEWRAAAAPFISIGLKQGEKCIYIVDTSTAEEIRKYLLEEGVDVASAEKSGQLSILHETEAYTREGSFDPDRMIALLISETEKAVSEGYPALRTTGEMTWVLRGYPGSAKLLEYEAKLNRDLFPQYPCLAICQYDRWKFDPEIIKGVIMTHPLLVRGSRVYRNFYYVEPKEFLHEKHAEAQVQHWLNNIERERLIWKELRESEESFKAVTENANDGIVVAASDGTHLYANKRASEITGYGIEELLKIGMKDLAHPDEIPKLSERLKKRIAGEEVARQYETAIVHKEGTAVSIEITGAKGFWHGRVADIVVFRDITERKRAEILLRQSLDQIDLLLNASSYILYRSEVFGDFDATYISSNTEPILGYKPDDFLQKGFWASKIHPEDAPRIFTELNQLFEHGFYKHEYRFQHKNGSWRWMFDELRLNRDEQGNPKDILGSMVDITERKRVEGVLRENEKRQQKYSTLLSELINRGEFFSGEPGENLRSITTISARLMNTERVSIWTYNKDYSQIRCEDLFELSKGAHSEGEVLQSSEFPDYTSNHKIGRVIAAEDVFTDPRTSKIPASYYNAYGIKSLLGAPVWVHDRLVGLLSFEHVGEIRQWQPEEEQLAQTLATYVSICFEASERKRAEDALQQNEERYRTLVEESFDGIFIQKGPKIIFVNRRLSEMLGYDKSELEGMDHWLVYHPDYQELTRERAKARMRGEKVPAQYEVKLQRKDGSAFDGEILARRIMFGDEPGIQVWIRDITERKKAEETIKPSEEKFSKAFRASPAWVIISSLEEGRYIEVNDAFLKSMGFRRDEVIGRTVFELKTWVNPKARTRLISELKERGSVRNMEVKVRKKSGELLDILLSAEVVEIAGEQCMLSASIDITERKQLEEGRRKSEEFQRAMVVCSPVALYSLDPDGNVLTWNASAERVFGWAAEEVVGKPLPIVPGDKQEEFREICRRVMLGQTFSNLETIRRKKDGTRLNVSLSTAPILDAEGNVIGIMSGLVDITESKRADEKLKESEERYRKFFDEDLTGDFISTPEGKILLCNPAFANILGFKSVDEALETSGSSLYFKESEWHKFLQLLGENKRLVNYEEKLIRNDGEKINVIENVIGTFDGQGKLIEIKGYIFDITERKRAEEERKTLEGQLHQSQKMEGIGRLAGGIAHDFNNVLTIIKGYSQLSLIDLKKGDPLIDNIEQIQKATDRAVDLTRQLLAFSRRQVMEMKVVDLNTIIRDLGKMLLRIIGEDIELVTFLADSLGRVKVDPGQMEQVIVNLTVNARDAMPSGGKLTIETANVELDEKYARNHVAVKTGRYVMLSVSDTGTGITPEVKERIFEPFYTTKEKGKGTGLGLSTVYGIVKQSGGNIWVYSEPGKGTTFKIYLPRVDEPLEEIKGKEELEEIPHGHETVLVVEDEEEVRKLAVKVLQKQGYQVLDAPNAGIALLLFKQHVGEIHLILTDVVMPQMSGPDLVKHLAPLPPVTKVLYMSGYTDNAIVHHGVLEEGMNFIQKPFSPDILARKVREALDKA
ncbi:MAG: PAS domain S-box protein [Deltaproteobacteria bacterium]|nr:PAS domain S-box protein [Deltaproteobacteria bacterium]